MLTLMMMSLEASESEWYEESVEVNLKVEMAEQEESLLAERL